MMKDTNQSRTHFFDEADYQREVVPSTQSLQASILERAKPTSQHIAADKPYSTSLTSLGKLFLWPPSLLQSAVMLSFMLVFSAGLYFIGVDDQHQGIDAEQKLVFEAFSENDLDWHELMLIDDELLFAQL
jgi:hypothetical protein